MERFLFCHFGTGKGSDKKAYSERWSSHGAGHQRLGGADERPVNVRLGELLRVALNRWEVSAHRVCLQATELQNQVHVI